VLPHAVALAAWCTRRGSAVHAAPPSRHCRPHEPEKIEHADTVSAWVKLNRDALLAHWRGDIDGAEIMLRTKPAPMTGG
jgi:hypothetical protein